MKEYYDILNRRKPMEDVGDAFKGQADAMRPMNVGQRREQALMRGFGAGINMGARAVDEAKIREIEEDSRQMAMLTKELTMATGKNQLREQKIKSFIADQDSNLKLASDLIVKGKYDQLDILAPSIFNAYKEHTGTNLGEYLFSKNGHISFKTPDGKIETMEAKTLFNPIMNYIPPEDRGNYKGFATSYQAEELDAIVETRRLRNELLQSQADNAKAHSNLYEAQAKEALRKAENPTMTKSQEIVFKSNVDNNQQYIKEARKKVITDKILVQTLNETEDMIIEAAKKGQVGSDLLSQGKRLWSKYLTGDNKEMTIADMAKAAYFARVKEAGGANPSTTEFLTALETIPNTDKNLLASLSVLKKDKNIALNNIYRFNNIEKNLRNNNYQGSPDDENIINFNEDEFNNFVNENSLKKTIRVSKKDKNTGKIDILDIPIDSFEDYYNAGYKFKDK